MTSCLWYRAALRKDLIVADQVSAIRDEFTEALGSAGWPDGACLFLVSRPRERGTKRDEDDDGEEGDAIFFSPAAIDAVPHLIAVCAAGPAPPPDRAYATLLVGSESDWDLLPRETH